MRKLIAFGLLLGILLAFPACKKQDDPATTTTSTTIPTTKKKEQQPVDLLKSLQWGLLNESETKGFYVISTTNNYPFPMQCVSCVVTIRAADGSILVEDDSRLPVPVIINREETAYLTGFYTLPEQFAGLNSNVDVEIKALPVEQERVSFRFENLDFKETPDGVLVSGTVWNYTGADASDCVVYVLAFGYSELKAMEPVGIQTLKQDEKQQFEVLLTGPRVKDITKVEGIGYDRALGSS